METRTCAACAENFEVGNLEVRFLRIWKHTSNTSNVEILQANSRMFGLSVEVVQSDPTIPFNTAIQILHIAFIWKSDSTFLKLYQFPSWEIVVSTRWLPEAFRGPSKQTAWSLKGSKRNKNEPHIAIRTNSPIGTIKQVDFFWFGPQLMMSIWNLRISKKLCLLSTYGKNLFD